MNAQNAHEYLPLVQALANGKTIQVLGKDGNWYDSPLLNTPPSRYRIKPKPRTYELMRSIKSGNVYELSNHSYNDNGLWERITVVEVQK
jgi:hypothetical protein